MGNVDILWIHDYINRKYGQASTHPPQKLGTEPRESNPEWNSQQKAPSKTDSEWEDLQIEEEPETMTNYGFYLLRAIPVIEDYRFLCNQKNKVKFLGTDGRSQEEADIQKKFQSIIKSYLRIVQLYFPKDYVQNEWDHIFYGISDALSPSLEKTYEEIELRDDSFSSVPRPVKKRCGFCHNDSDNFEIFENHWICECGFVSNATHSTSSYKDIDRINLSSKYTYDRRIHFRDCLSQFQGKQNAKIDPDEVYQPLIQQLFLHGIIPENFEQLPKEEAFAEVTKEHLQIFLKEIKQTKHYEDLTLIHHELTGKPTPDISHLESQLLNDFDVLVETYDRRYRNSERKNFINTQYVLFQLLRRHKYPCKKEDFNMLKTIDRKYFHDSICSELFTEIGWSFTALF